MSDVPRFVARPPRGLDMREALGRVSRIAGVRVLDDETPSAALLEVPPPVMAEVALVLKEWSIIPEVQYPLPGIRRPKLE